MIHWTEIFAGIAATIMPVLVGWIKKDIRTLKLSINGRIEELLTVARVLARREGFDEGRAHERSKAVVSRSRAQEKSRRQTRNRETGTT